MYARIQAKELAIAHVVNQVIDASRCVAHGDCQKPMPILQKRKTVLTRRILDDVIGVVTRVRLGVTRTNVRW
jgi:hypothetical protein